MKKFKNGMYGGKFMPFHKGHLQCIELASKECEIAHLILFANGLQEQAVLNNDNRDFLSLDNRSKTIERIAKMFPNVIPHVIDILPSIVNGEEDWDLQTPMVINEIGMPDAVYGSEPSYSDYFARAYPEAEYRVVDMDREVCPISGTKVRSMTDEERLKWIV